MPTGNNPSGWTIGLPTSGIGASWSSTGTFDSNGNLIGNWSIPARSGGIATFTQNTDPANMAATRAGDLWFDTTDASKIQINVRNSANSGWVNNTLATLSVANLLSGTMTGINIDIVGGGRILFNNGSVWNVIGTGFGSANQFVEWFGPAQSNLSQCTEGKAISYKRIDGSAYFGGTLFAGTTTNSQNTTDSSASAQVILGPFSTGGHLKVVTVRYTFSASGGENYDYYNGTGLSTSVQLYRTIAGGAETLVATNTLSGSFQGFSIPVGGGHTWSENFGGNFSYDDTDPSGANRTYRAKISSRSVVTTVGCGQSLGITSVEN